MKSLNTFIKSLVIIICVLFPQIVFSQTDDLQAAFDALPQTRSTAQTVVDLSNFSALERTRPLYIRNGGNFKVINGTLSRAAELKDSAVVVITGGSTVQLADGVTISGGGTYTGHELVLVENGTLTVEGATFCDMYVDNSNSLIRPITTNNDNSIRLQQLESASSTLYFNSGSIIVGRLGVTTVRGIENEGGQMYLNGGDIPYVSTDCDFIINGKVKIDKLILGLNKKMIVTSAIENPISITLPSIPETRLSITEAQPPTGNFDGYVVATGSDKYTLAQSDIDNITLNVDAELWELRLEDNKAVIRPKASFKVSTLDDLQAAIDAAVGRSDTINIEVDGTIEISSPIVLPEGVNVKLTGGRLQRADGHYTEMFYVDELSTVTFENIMIDGNYITTESSVFTIDYCGKIVFGTDVEVCGHKDSYGHGLIFASENGKGATVIIDGAMFYGNELAGRMFTHVNKYYNLEIDFKSGHIIDNMQLPCILDGEEFKMTGGGIWGDGCYFDRGGEYTTVRPLYGHFENTELYGVSIYVDKYVYLKNVETSNGDLNSEIVLKPQLADDSGFIMQASSLTQEINLRHDSNSVYIDSLSSGTLVVRGYDGYVLTEDDLAHYKYTSDKWELELDKKNNIIVLKAKTIENEDDLQDFFDQLAESDNKGTEKEPIDIIFGESAPTVELTKPMEIPEGSHVRFVGGNIVLTEPVGGLGGSSFINIDAESSVQFSGTTITAQQMNTTETLIEVSGKLIIDVDCYIKIYVNLSGGSVIHVKPEGTLELGGGEFSGNTAGNTGIIHVQGNTIINDVTFTENTGGSHGLIYIDGGTCHYNGGSITNNTTINGIFYVEQNSHFYFNGGTLSNNTVSGNGTCGGIYVNNGGNVYFTGGHISNNGTYGQYWNGTINIYPGYSSEGDEWVSAGVNNIIRIISKLEIEIRLHLHYELIVSGTIVAQGTEDYILTEEDLAKFVCDSDEWTFVLNKEENCIVVKSNVESSAAGEAIDLGLSVKWASCNVGATEPWEYGGYYAWGETEEKEDYSWSTYKWCNGTENSMIKYCTDSNYGTVDNKTTLDPEDDVAHVKWGGNWRMPTLDEIDELKNNCTWRWGINKNHVYGHYVHGPNGNKIFLPVAGCRYGADLSSVGSYGDGWSSSLGAYDSRDAYYFFHYSNGILGTGIDNRCFGRTVRPVYDDSTSTAIEIITPENNDENIIYDLRGQKLTEITAPGIYIINGKKVVVQ